MVVIHGRVTCVGPNWVGTFPDRFLDIYPFLEQYVPEPVVEKTTVVVGDDNTQVENDEGDDNEGEVTPVKSKRGRGKRSKKSS